MTIVSAVYDLNVIVVAVIDTLRRTSARDSAAVGQIERPGVIKGKNEMPPEVVVW